MRSPTHAQSKGRGGAERRESEHRQTTVGQNSAFEKLPAGTVDTLLKPENKPMLTKVLTYHVVAGKLSSVELKKQITEAKGMAHVKTVRAGTLMATIEGHAVLEERLVHVANARLALLPHDFHDLELLLGENGCAQSVKHGCKDATLRQLTAHD